MNRYLALTAALALVACGGGGSSGTPSPTPSPSPSPSPTPTPTPGATTPYSLVFSTLLDGASGTTYEMTRDIAIDAQGFIYVTGGTTAPDFPTTPKAYDQVFGTGGTAVGAQGPGDIFVTKMTPTGQIVWSTFVGGPNYDRAYAIRVGTDGSVYIAGRAGPGFPTTPGVVQPAFAGDNGDTFNYGQQDGFVAKLSGDGGNLIWSTYIGDAGGAFLRDMDIDSQGRPYLAVVNINQPMTQFITANAWQTTRKDAKEGAYIRLSADAKQVQYGTYFGASGSAASGDSTGVASIRVAPDGSVVVASVERGTNFATTSGAFQRDNKGGSDLIVMKFSPSDQISFATYLGGSGDEEIETHLLAIDNSGRIYVGSDTASTDYPTTIGTIQRQFGGGNHDAFISVLSPDGRQLLASTFFGGNGNEIIEGINVSHRNGAADAVVVSGSTSSTNIVATTGAPQTHNAGQSDAFAAVLSADLSALRFFTYFGAAGSDQGRTSAITSDASRIYFGGHTLSDGFPTTAGAIDSQRDGTYAAWIAALKLN